MVAEELIKEEFPNSLGIPALLTWHREDGLTDADLAEIQYVSQTLTKTPLNEQSYVPPLDQVPLPALKGSVSEKDSTTFVQPIFFEENAGTDVLKKNITEIQDMVTRRIDTDPFQAKTDSKNLSVRVTGPVGIAVDTTSLFKGADFQLLLATVVPSVSCPFTYLSITSSSYYSANWCWLCLFSHESDSWVYGRPRLDYR